MSKIVSAVLVVYIVRILNSELVLPATIYNACKCSQLKWNTFYIALSIIIYSSFLLFNYGFLVHLAGSHTLNLTSVFFTFLLLWFWLFLILALSLPTTIPFAASSMYSLQMNLLKLNMQNSYYLLPLDIVRFPPSYELITLSWTLV